MATTRSPCLVVAPPLSHAPPSWPDSATTMSPSLKRFLSSVITVITIITITRLQRCHLLWKGSSLSSLSSVNVVPVIAVIMIALFTFTSSQSYSTRLFWHFEKDGSYECMQTLSPPAVAMTLCKLSSTMWSNQIIFLQLSFHFSILIKTIVINLRKFLKHRVMKPGHISFPILMNTLRDFCQLLNWT